MIKILKLSILSAFILSFSVNNVQAKLKIDIVSSVGQIQSTVTSYVKTASEKIEEIMSIKNKNLLGDGKESISSLASIKSKVKGYVAEGEKVRKEAGNYKSDYDSYYNQYKEITSTDLSLSALTSYAPNAYELLLLQNERKNLIADYDRKIEAETARYDGEIAKIENNINVQKEKLAELPDNKSASTEEVRKSLNSKISDLENQKQVLLEIHEQNKEKILQEALAYLSTLDARTEHVTELLLTNSKNDSQSGILGLINKSPEELLKEAAEKNYLKENEVQNSSNVRNLRDVREVQALEDNLQMAFEGLKVRLNIFEAKETAAEISSNVGIQEGANSATILDTELSNENIKATLDRMNLELWKLIASSSYDLIMSSEYRMAEVAEDSDISKINFCDYKYKKPAKQKTESDVKNDEDVLKGLLGIK